LFVKAREKKQRKKKKKKNVREKRKGLCWEYCSSKHWKKGYVMLLLFL